MSEAEQQTINNNNTNAAGGAQLSTLISSNTTAAPTQEHIPEEDLVIISSSTKSNNRAINYTTKVHMELIEAIVATGMLKPPGTDSIWIQLNKNIFGNLRTPKILFSHWTEMLSYMKLGRSNTTVKFPTMQEASLASTSSDETLDEKYERLCEAYYSDLLKVILNCKGKCSKSWWDIDVVKGICKLQMRVEAENGLDKKQDADSLAATGKAISNKFEQETELRKVALQKARQAEEEKNQANQAFKTGLLGALGQMTSTMKELTSPNGSVSEINTPSTASMAASATNDALSNRVGAVESKMDSIHEMLKTLVGQKRGQEAAGLNNN